MSTSQTFVLASSLLGILCSGVAVGQRGFSATESQTSFNRSSTSTEQRTTKRQENVSISAPLIFWQQDRLPIPFNIKSTSDAREVQLYVSTDQGAHWQLYDRKVPAARRFLFRAPRDGEFWFASRTLQHEEKAAATTPQHPELRVVIDTTKPVFKMNSLVKPSGKVQTTWEISDPHLKTNSFKLQYQPLGGTSWIPVPLDHAAESTKQRWNGQWLWWPETKSRSLVLRGVIEDKAGNQAVQTGRLFLPAVALRRPPTSAASGRRPQVEPTNTGRVTSPRSDTRGFVAAGPATNQALRTHSWDDDTENEQFISTAVPSEVKRNRPENPTYRSATNKAPAHGDPLQANPYPDSPTTSGQTYRTPSTEREREVVQETTTGKRSWETTPGSPYQRGSDQRSESAETLPSPTLNTTGKRSWETTPESSYQGGSDQRDAPAETLPSPTLNTTGKRSWETTPE
ncbi:MAG: hypothetical protein VX346_04275, partial [Planctomycetota bacterium]|nr:hypothetical protein [Planctomycetota bacterium]